MHLSTPSKKDNYYLVKLGELGFAEALGNRRKRTCQIFSEQILNGSKPEPSQSHFFSNAFKIKKREWRV